MEAPNDTITQQQEVKARQVLGRARRVIVERKDEARPTVRVELRYAGVVATLVDARHRSHHMQFNADTTQSDN